MENRDLHSSRWEYAAALKMPARGKSDIHVPGSDKNLCRWSENESGIHLWKPGQKNDLPGIAAFRSSIDTDHLSGDRERTNIGSRRDRFLIRNMS